jgi:hypothetical protein
VHASGTNWFDQNTVFGLIVLYVKNPKFQVIMLLEPQPESTCLTLGPVLQEHIAVIHELQHRFPSDGKGPMKLLHSQQFMVDVFTSPQFPGEALQATQLRYALAGSGSGVLQFVGLQEKQVLTFRPSSTGPHPLGGESTEYCDQAEDWRDFLEHEGVLAVNLTWAVYKLCCNSLGQLFEYRP